jgi:hypothetical protein
LALVSAGALTFPPAATPASAQAAVSVSLFYGELAPHGRWFQHPRWGWAWFPTAVDADWRPYAQGQWAWTEENGWYWISDEPFGWAVYHYGRWAYDGEYGWIWIPGSTWGPAWVAFRESDEYVGWAPLPPETLEADYGWQGIYTALDASYYQPRWVFVPRRHFLARHAYAYAAPAQRNVVIIRVTRDVTRYERRQRGVFNRGFEPRRLEAALGRRIAPLRINVVNDPRRAAPDRAGRQVNVFRPAMRVTRDAAPPPAARVRPQDRPRVRIQREAVAPSDRRERATPPATPSARPPVFRAPDTATPRTAPPQRTAPPPRIAAPPGAVPRSVQPDRRREREERRVAPPAPGRVAPPAPRMATPPQPPRAPELRREQRAAPVQPPRAAPRPPAAATPQRPPSFAAPPAPRSAPPGFARPSSPPPRVAPSAPPTPRAQPPARKAQPPAAKRSPSRRDEERRGR